MSGTSEGAAKRWARPEAHAQQSEVMRRHWAHVDRGPGLRELVDASSPGECPLCGSPRAQNPRGRKSLTCGDEICRAAYHRYYARDRRARARGEGPQQ